MSNFFDVHNVLLDIEGTTTSSDFVKGILLPYFCHNIRDFMKIHAHDLREIIHSLIEQSEIDKRNKVEGAVFINRLSDLGRIRDDDVFLESLCKNVIWQTSINRKTPSLKKIHGLIWEHGYMNKTIKGHIYEDVPIAIQKWREKGMKIYIYSSGSVISQKLLFSHTIHGDLSNYIDGYFDSTIGSKNDPMSYERILKDTNSSGQSMLFLTDVRSEAEAAREAGLSVVIVKREEDGFHKDLVDPLLCISNFQELNLV